MRFTIRDLLWLMVVVALACALFVRHRKCNQLEAEVSNLTDKIEEKESQAVVDRNMRKIELNAFKVELDRIGGKRLKLWGYGADDAGPDGFTFTFKYADDEPESK
jgi:hypothetical protein